MSAGSLPPDQSDDGMLHQAQDAADGGSSVQDGVPTETLTDSPSRLPKRIGQYHIKRVIASGGMGTVYEAVQEKPRRPVALKLMKQGIASRSALRRFEYESQILARLRHPGIAQVYDAGTHKDNSGTTPYFAMEYIPNALPITKYVKEKKLGTRERMALFAQVCEAVHHGHQKGIIHRDLKPSNILVDAHGQVKIIDFGVARSTDSDLAVTTLQTDVGQLIGTLQYMSPEQCAADPHDIDTRSDVYALGVVFYELLTEHLPYDVRKKAVFEATRVIREEQPTKLTTINKTLSGDIETIALKALEKERDRRYQSATDFGQDIRRYLSNEAITARRASVMYQFRVLVRRNKPIFAAIAAVFVVLIGATIVSTSMYFKSETNRIKAESQTKKAVASGDFVQRMVQSVDPLLRGKASQRITIRSMLDAATARLDEGELADVPEVEAGIRLWLGETYRNMEVRAQAQRNYARAVELHRETLGVDAIPTLIAERKLAIVLPAEEAVPALHRILELQRRTLGAGHPRSLPPKLVLAMKLDYQNRCDEAGALWREIIRAFEEDPDLANHWSSGKWLAPNNLAGCLLKHRPNGDDSLIEAERLLRSIVKPNPTFFEREALDTLAGVLIARGKLAEAEEIARENMAARRRALDSRHSDYRETWYILLKVLIGRGKFEEARSLINEELVAIGDSTEPAFYGILHSMARTLLECKVDQLCDPQTALRPAIRAVEMTEGKNARILDTLALAYFKAGDMAMAVETQEKAVSLLSAESPLRAELVANLAKYRAALEGGDGGSRSMDAKPLDR